MSKAESEEEKQRYKERLNTLVQINKELENLLQ
jgi:hypothetical protein